MIEISTANLGSVRKAPWQAGVAVGRAYELLRSDVQEHLRVIQSAIGFRGCRFHGLFHDDMQVVVRDADGKLRFQWSHVAKVFDFLLSVGLTPFVELNPMPLALASGPTTFFYWRMNVTPPQVGEEWEQLVESFANWACRRYGTEAVRSWHFEVWNEPNLEAFWDATPEQYEELYLRSARALHRVDSTFRVGGPASAEGGWIDRFLAGAGADADFVSTHLYPMNEYATYATREESAYVPGRYMVDRLKKIRAQVRDRPLYITEWNSLDAPDRDSVDWFDNPTIDGIASAAVTARMGIELEAIVDGLFWWVASDVFEECGMPQSPFSGTYGMLTVDGIPKPSFHAFSFLKALQGRRLDVAGDFPEGTGLAAAHDAGITRAVAWNHVPAGLPPRPWLARICLPQSEGQALRTIVHVHPGRGSAYELWVQMGKPQNPTPIQFMALRAASTPDVDSCVVDAAEPVIRELGENEILFIEWAPPGDPYVPKELLSEQSLAWNTALAAVPPVSGVDE